jgi:hypothetical protein
MLQASGQDEQDIEPVLANGHGRKNRSHLEVNWVQLLILQAFFHVFEEKTVLLGH